MDLNKRQKSQEKRSQMKVDARVCRSGFLSYRMLLSRQIEYS